VLCVNPGEGGETTRKDRKKKAGGGDRLESKIAEPVLAGPADQGAPSDHDEILSKKVRAKVGGKGEGFKEGRRSSRRRRKGST